MLFCCPGLRVSAQLYSVQLERTYSRVCLWTHFTVIHAVNPVHVDIQDGAGESDCIALIRAVFEANCEDFLKLYLLLLIPQCTGHCTYP